MGSVPRFGRRHGRYIVSAAGHLEYPPDEYPPNKCAPNMEYMKGSGRTVDRMAKVYCFTSMGGDTAVNMNTATGTA